MLCHLLMRRMLIARLRQVAITRGAWPTPGHGDPQEHSDQHPAAQRPYQHRRCAPTPRVQPSPTRQTTAELVKYDFAETLTPVPTSV